MHAIAIRVMAIAIALFALAANGCSGKAISRAFTLPGGNASPGVNYRPYPNYNYFPGSANPHYNDSHYRSDPLVRFPSDSRLAPRDAGNILSRHLAEFSGAFGANFATLHLQLPYGLSAVNPHSYVMASPNVFVTADTSVPPGMHLNLLSERDTVSFVTYGLLSPNSSQRVMGLDVKGAASFAVGDEHGLYVGVRQFGEPRYNWYGPFKANEKWHVNALRDSSYEPGSAAYITLAVFNGDIVRVDSLSIDLGG